ncbi:hypothetical protein E1A91_D05G238200v1 [Gossypium mustelinum]|uniref:Protein kinase domain-containing protein n=1 Tax=Gossypium mustelinum TaxID=34275 RepID=A0A5D2V050_GOSMU|nr:hypothetical protein E1A91_D05G238200v1 [Gossypium mustelinum]
MRKKRKGSETDASPEVTNKFASACDYIRSHFSLEDFSRIKKRCKEDVDTPPVGSCKSRLAGIATGPPCGASSLVPLGRGLKRKMGCIEVITGISGTKKVQDDYVKGNTIEQGKFRSIWLCRSRTSGVEFACKTLLRGEETVHREVEIMQHLSGHPGFVTLQVLYEEPDCLYLQPAANIFKDVMLVIKYCHDMGVVHRDIKLENILLATSGKIKLADFGHAMRISNVWHLSLICMRERERNKFLVETIRLLFLSVLVYVAPEVLLGNYSQKVDILSAGVPLHVLLVGVLPFQGDSLRAVFEAIKNVKLDFRGYGNLMLTRDVSSRITAGEGLRHPWILFYTKCSLKTLSIKSKSKNQVGPSIQISNSPGSESILTSLSSSCKSEEQDKNGVVDLLAVAISHVRISESKRSRLCSPTRPIEQQCSSNLTVNNLRRAF